MRQRETRGGGVVAKGIFTEILLNHSFLTIPTPRLKASEIESAMCERDEKKLLYGKRYARNTCHKSI